jgi:glyceraldehyde-3-phosphate dehydrogenase type II
MAQKKIVHVVGTGTIGEPLIGFYTDFKAKWGIDEVTFHKRTPKADDRAMVEHLLGRGAKLVVDEESRGEFEALGHRVSFNTEEALARATVVVDCTPAGNDNKAKYYDRIKGPLGFIAQGSEFGFGTPYAWGINDSVLDDESFIQVVSCNTHSIASLIKTIASDDDGKTGLENGRFVCMRRANDVSDTKSFLAAPQVGKHDDPEFGTHHARDAYHLFATLGEKLNLYSSAIKLNTQYMHSLWFELELKEETTLEEVKAALRGNTNVAITNKRAANQIFSFGRDHGYYGRILSQTVVPLPTLAMPTSRRVVGFCYTPQDGNSLVSSIAATLRFLDPDRLDQEVAELRPYFFREI